MHRKIKNSKKRMLTKIANGDNRAMKRWSDMAAKKIAKLKRLGKKSIMPVADREVYVAPKIGMQGWETFAEWPAEEVSEPENL